MDDETLSRTLTSAVRDVPHVLAVYPPRPIVQAAAEVVAATLALREPDVLVDVDRSGAALRVSAGIAVDDRRPATDTVRAVGERIRSVVDGLHGPRVDVVTVTVRLIEESGG